jgi:hypothetical protein
MKPSVRIACAALLPILATGCDKTSFIRITTPADSAMVTAPTPTRIELSPLGYTPNSLSVVLEQPMGSDFSVVADLTSAFAAPAVLGPNQFGTAAAIAVPRPGSYRIRAGACWNGEIYFVIAPNFPTSACKQAAVAFTVVQPAVTASVAALDLTAGISGTLGITLVPAPAANQQVDLASPLARPVVLGIAAGTAGATIAAIQPLLAGSGTLTATAPPPYGRLSIPLTVRPQLTAASPAAAMPGATITVNGEGFVAPMRADFARPGIPDAAATVVNPQTATFTLPPFLSPGPEAFRIYAANQPSTAQRNIQILAGPAPAVPFILYRSHATGIEVISFTPGSAGPPGTFALLPGGIASTVSPGLMVVGLEHNGANLVRSSSTAIEEFTIGGTANAPVLARAGQSPSTGQGSAALTGVGASVATQPGGSYVRGTDRGLEVWTLNTAPLVKAGSQQNMAGTSSTGVAVLVDNQMAVRSTASSLERWSIAGGNPSLVPNGVNTQVFSAQVGTGLAWIINGSYAVRSFASGIEIIEVTPSGTARPAGAFNNRGGTVPFAAVGVASSANGPVAVRATANGLEVYSLPSPIGTKPVLCGVSREGDTSPGGGVAVATSGPWVFRASSYSIEAYWLGGVTCPMADNLGLLTLNPAILRNGLALATTGLGLAWTINLP